MITLIPAYGRDYKSKKDVLADWNAGKDFVIQAIMHPYDGKPANKRDMATETSSVMLRYQRLTKVLIAKTK